MKIAITGGIGSGKSTLCSILKQMGHTVLSCDAICAELYLNADFCRHIGVALGVEFDGTVQSKRRLAEIVFGDKGKLNLLNSLVHPAVYREINRRAAKEGLTFVEVPLLFESGGIENFDKVVIVMRDDGERMRATAARDGISEQHVQKRMQNQVDYEKIDKSVHTVLINDGTIEDLRQKADALVKTLSENC